MQLIGEAAEPGQALETILQKLGADLTVTPNQEGGLLEGHFVPAQIDYDGGEDDAQAPEDKEEEGAGDAVLPGDGEVDVGIGVETPQEDEIKEEKRDEKPIVAQLDDKNAETPGQDQGKFIESFKGLKDVVKKF